MADRCYGCQVAPFLTGSTDGQISQFQRREPTLMKPASTPNLRPAVLLAAAATLLLALLWAGPATAYDPATDQYSPSTPSGGGPVPTEGEDNSGGTGAVGNSDSGEGNAPPPTGAVPVTPVETGPAEAPVNASPDDRDRRDVRDLAAQARQQRETLAASNADGPAVRSPIDQDGDQGMGIALPIILALMLIGAVGTRFLGRRDGGHPA